MSVICCTLLERNEREGFPAKSEKKERKGKERATQLLGAGFTETGLESAALRFLARADLHLPHGLHSAIARADTSRAIAFALRSHESSIPSAHENLPQETRIQQAIRYDPGMIANCTLQAEDRDAGERLDAFILARVPTSSRSLVLEAIEKKWLSVNGRREKKGYKINPGDKVVIDRLLEASDWKAAPNAEIRISVIHEDPSFLVIDKPPGVPVHPLEPFETDTVVNGLVAAYPDVAGIGPDRLFPAIVHRLDTETSGVMLAARTKAAYDALRRQFRDKRVSKKYVALVCGRLSENASLENWLTHSPSGPHRMLVAEQSARKAMMAITEYSVRETLSSHTLLDVTIRTGVTHQIRCQLAHIEHPLAGDVLYGSKEADAGYEGRLFLHAREISFADPVTGTERCFHSELPGELSNLLQRLRGGKTTGNAP